LKGGRIEVKIGANIRASWIARGHSRPLYRSDGSEESGEDQIPTIAKDRPKGAITAFRRSFSKDLGEPLKQTDVQP